MGRIRPGYLGHKNNGFLHRPQRITLAAAWYDAGKIVAGALYPKSVLNIRNIKKEPFMADPKTILEFVKKNGVKILDLRFTDLPGLQHHVSYPIDTS
jgi:hypothetical protein